ncbi:Crp/Fnr family transcriptional regulator [Bernardetia sp.]|uniref:Crp/Fnr family transcriptional regulator n=1 Tax=Bernardetia sp. TaxID=1937974 RepID=UPI0025BB3E0B|nr:Crp/Fnr family transcriptional regulator [Bernardetia sp.]
MNSHQNILKNIKRYVDLSSQDEEAFVSIIKRSRVKKRQFIVQPNFVCTHQTYIEKGTFRSYFLTDQGTEHTLQFAIEDWFISDFTSYIYQKPASLYVEALQDSIIDQIEYNEVENLCNTHPVFEKFFRIVAQKSFAFAQQRILSNLGKTAAERYREFNKMYPTIVERVPQYALASYLGMSAEFLSKIKKEMQP